MPKPSESKPSEAPRGLRPGGAVRGSLRAPGSKSIAQRALVAAGLASGDTRIAGLPEGEDVRHARGLLRAVGVGLDELAPAAVTVHGRPPGPHRGWSAGGTVEVGESGTLARFALATLGLCARAGERVEVAASGSLVRRRSDALVRALSEAGVRFERTEWPIVLRPIGPPSQIVLRSPRSSQEASALAIALAAWPDEIELAIEGELPSRPYFEMTLRVLERFGVRATRAGSAKAERIAVRGPLRAPEDPLAIEPDASLASVALAAACVSGGEVTASGLTTASVQGDVRVAEHLRAFGCRAVFEREGLTASGFPQRGADIDLSGEPDLAPVLAVVAAGAAMVADPGSATSRFRGLETLPGKESSRIEVLARGLSAAGWTVEASENEMRIGPARARLSQEAIVLDPAGDHRMAFAFALIGLLRGGVEVADPGCVAKSWPGFWRDMSSLGARE